MADATTPNYGFRLPSVGLDRDTWGQLLNDNWLQVDADLAAVAGEVGPVNARIDALIATIVAYVEPVGSIKPWPAPNAPAGWLPCDGWAISRTDFADLFAVIGGYWGVGDGSTTFNIPDWQGWTPVGVGGWMPYVGAKLGETSHTLSQAEMPSHTHLGWTDVQDPHAHNFTALQPGGQPRGIGGDNGFAPATAQSDVQGWHSHNVFTEAAGADQAHNNIQPSVGVLWIIKAVHVGF